MIRLMSTMAVPLTLTEDGVIRVGGTRVPLDAVVHEFREGASAEQILHSYPSLTLRDIYGAITYYLTHTEEIDAYLREQDALAEETRRLIEARFPADGLRARLLARMKERNGREPLASNHAADRD